MHAPGPVLDRSSASVHSRRTLPPAVVTSSSARSRSTSPVTTPTVPPRSRRCIRNLHPATPRRAAGPTTIDLEMSVVRVGDRGVRERTREQNRVDSHVRAYRRATCAFEPTAPSRTASTASPSGPYAVIVASSSSSRLDPSTASSSSSTSLCPHARHALPGRNVVEGCPVALVEVIGLGRGRPHEGHSPVGSAMAVSSRSHHCCGENPDVTSRSSGTRHVSVCPAHPGEASSPTRTTPPCGATNGRSRAARACARARTSRREASDPVAGLPRIPVRHLRVRGGARRPRTGHVAGRGRAGQQRSPAAPARRRVRAGVRRQRVPAVVALEHVACPGRVAERPVDPATVVAWRTAYGSPVAPNASNGSGCAERLQEGSGAVGTNVNAAFSLSLFVSRIAAAAAPSRVREPARGSGQSAGSSPSSAQPCSPSGVWSQSPQLSGCPHTAHAPSRTAGAVELVPARARISARSAGMVMFRPWPWARTRARAAAYVSGVSRCEQARSTRGGVGLRGRAGGAGHRVLLRSARSIRPVWRCPGVKGNPDDGA